ncbi:hypothetical protein RRG08_045445 [Elysia crispata]|uniref:Uncharacterized protein n=1 Tax=Elysia crispata TaxID=231223 RepID=A0AAE1AWS3_9GAST|nr:hypothetical protein RRG08_045445 [Elysia crispata]
MPTTWHQSFSHHPHFATTINIYKQAIDQEELVLCSHLSAHDSEVDQRLSNLSGWTYLELPERPHFPYLSDRLPQTDGGHKEKRLPYDLNTRLRHSCALHCTGALLTAGVPSTSNKMLFQFAQYKRPRLYMSYRRAPAHPHELYLSAPGTDVTQPWARRCSNCPRMLHQQSYQSVGFWLSAESTSLMSKLLTSLSRAIHWLMYSYNVTVTPVWLTSCFNQLLKGFLEEIHKLSCSGILFG